MLLSKIYFQYIVKFLKFVFIIQIIINDETSMINFKNTGG